MDPVRTKTTRISAGENQYGKWYAASTGSFNAVFLRNVQEDQEITIGEYPFPHFNKGKDGRVFLSSHTNGTDYDNALEYALNKSFKSLEQEDFENYLQMLTSLGVILSDYHKGLIAQWTMSRKLANKNE